MNAVVEIIGNELTHCGVHNRVFDEHVTFQWRDLLASATGKVPEKELSNWDVRCATNLLHRLGITGFTNDDLQLRLPTYAEIGADDEWEVSINNDW